ncbi:zinc finger CCCH domain-containing protein 13-like isoform X2 [Scylla paramamosain]
MPPIPHYYESHAHSTYPYPNAHSLPVSVSQSLPPSYVHPPVPSAPPSGSLSIPKSPRSRSHRLHRSSSHTHSRRRHRKRIHFPKMNTRYSRMKLNVGSLDLSGKGLLNMLHQNRSRCLKSCWEREIIPRVPPKPAPDTVPTSEQHQVEGRLGSAEPESAVFSPEHYQEESLLGTETETSVLISDQYEDSMEVMLAELEKDMETFLSDNETNVTQEDSPSVPRPPFPVTKPPLLPNTSRPPQQASSNFKPTQQASITKPSQSSHLTSHSQASTIRPQGTSNITNQQASHITNPSQPSTSGPQQASHITNSSQPSTSGPQQANPITNPSQPSTTNPPQPDSHTLTEPHQSPTEPRGISQPIGNTLGQRHEHPPTTEVAVSSLLAFLKRHTAASRGDSGLAISAQGTCSDSLDSTAASHKDSPGQGSANIMQDETVMLKLMRLLQEGSISEGKDGKHVLVFEKAPGPDLPSTSEPTASGKQGATEAPPCAAAKEVDREGRERLDKERRKMSIEVPQRKTGLNDKERRETEWEKGSKDKKRKHRMDEAEEKKRDKEIKEKEREMENRNQRKHKNNEREEIERRRNNKEDKNRKRRREKEGREEKTETELNRQNKSRRREEKAEERDRQKDSKRRETEWEERRKKNHKQRSRSPSDWRRRNTRSPSSSSSSPTPSQHTSPSTTNTADTHTRRGRKPSTSSKSTRTPTKGTSSDTRTSSPNRPCKTPRQSSVGQDKQAAGKSKGTTLQHQKSLEAQREALQSVGEVRSVSSPKTAEKCKRNRWDQETGDRRDITSPEAEKHKRNRWDQETGDRRDSTSPPEAEKHKRNRWDQETGDRRDSTSPPEAEKHKRNRWDQGDTGDRRDNTSPPEAEKHKRNRWDQKERESASSETSPEENRKGRCDEERESVCPPLTSEKQKKNKWNQKEMRESVSGETSSGKQGSKNRLASQEDTRDTSPSKTCSQRHTENRRPSQEDISNIPLPKSSKVTVRCTTHKPPQTQSARPSQEDTRSIPVAKSCEGPQTPCSTPHKPPQTQSSKNHTLPQPPQDHNSTPSPDSSKRPRPLPPLKKTSETHTNLHTNSLPPAAAPRLRSPPPCTPHHPAGAMVKEEPLFFLSEAEIKQEPFSPTSALHQKELEDQARQVRQMRLEVKREAVRVKQELVSSNQRVDGTPCTHRYSATASLSDIPVKTEPAEEEEAEETYEYEDVEKTDPFLEGEEEEEADRIKVRCLMKATLEVLGMEEDKDSNMWDSSVPESLYEHLKNILFMMECSVWEESTILSYNWEVNLRRLVVATFCREELDTFTRDIHRNMQKTKDLKMFVRSVISSNAIP